MSAAKDIGLDGLYQEIIMDHRRDPRHFGVLEKFNAKAEGFNPMCGDRVELRLWVDPLTKQIKDIRFTGEGCSLCMASASMLTEEVLNLRTDELLKKVEIFRSEMQGKNDIALIEGDLESLLGVKKFPVRIKCVLLPWTTVKDAVEQHCVLDPQRNDDEAP